MIPYKPISNRLTDDGYEGLSDSEKMIITEQMRYMSDMEKLFRVNGSERGRDCGEVKIMRKSEPRYGVA